jgi:hypothetical protein
MVDSWLSPGGDIKTVGRFEHNRFAFKMLEEEMGHEQLLEYMSSNNWSSATEILHSRGWVRIKFNTSYFPRIQLLGNCIDLTRPMRNTIDPGMNQRQLSIAKKLCQEYNTPFYVAINDKRFW